MNDIIYKSGSDEWETPQEIFDSLNREFHFTLDPCATETNHKCSKWFGKDTDGLVQNWGGQSVFVNPPYSQISNWVKKAFYEAQQDDTTVVLLIPARTDTKYFHRYILHRSEIRFIRGRVKFLNSNKIQKYNSTFPSMVVIF